MSGEAVVSAPGKTILFGEHAAVYGHAALVAALDHRMTVTARVSAAADAGVIRLEIPSLRLVRSVAFTHRIENVREPGDLAIIAVAVATANLESHPAGLHIRIDSSIPSGSGFGSSAALAVAVVAACRRACGVDVDVDADEIARLASSVEQHQHGRSSGVDIQAVLRGGVLVCRRLDDGSLEREDLPEAGARLDAFRLFHSGAPNETTGETVDAVRRVLDREPARARDAFAAIESATLEGRAAILSGDDDAFIPIVRRAEAALETLGVVPAGVHETIRAIEADGGAAKVSGAGGLTGARAGLVLVVHPDPAWHERFVPPTGWRAHRVRLGAQGLRSEIAA
jgi:mevalonate kinase